MEYSGLADAIVKEMVAYSREVDDLLKEKIDETAKEVRSQLANSPDIPKRTGKYKRSFFVRKVADGMGYHRMVVANRQYQLTHLLERGHVTRSGGRTRAYPHWEKAEQVAQTLYQKVLEGIGK